MSSTDQRQHLLFEREKHFQNFQLWPLSQTLNLRRWLGNFHNEEQEFALRLANAFCFFSQEAVDAMFAASLQRYFNLLGTRHLIDPSAPLKRVAFVPVEGERPNTSDSGHLFARRLKKKLGVPESKLLYPEQAIANHQNFDTFIFVDDFVGSGNQMFETFIRPYNGNSFSNLAAAINVTMGYCACVFTEKGKSRLERDLPRLELSTAHTLGAEYNLSLPTAPCWKGLDPADVLSFLRTASARAGYVEEDESEDDWRGFHALGLSIGFSHGVPDANLPIFFSTRNGWKPLVT